MPDIKEVYEMVVKQSPPQPDALERQRKRQDAIETEPAGRRDRRGGRDRRGARVGVRGHATRGQHQRAGRRQRQPEPIVQHDCAHRRAGHRAERNAEPAVRSDVHRPVRTSALSDRSAGGVRRAGGLGRRGRNPTG